MVFVEAEIPQIPIISATATKSYPDTDKISIENAFDGGHLRSRDNCYLSEETQDLWAYFEIPMSKVSHLKILNRDRFGQYTGRKIKNFKVFIL